jgi:chloramphenicol O-acetyltransferase type A
LFFYYLHKSILAINAVEAFRYRIEGEEVFLYDTVGASATVDRPDGTFGFSHIGFFKDFEKFEQVAKKEFERVRANTDLVPGSASENVIHYSSLPWLKFTGLSHARSFKRLDSTPKISFGKITEQNGKRLMPVSIHVHHALVDGLHVGQHVEAFQDFLNGED